MMSESVTVMNVVQKYEESKLITAKAQAFKIIYGTMQKCQRNISMFKTDFLDDKDGLSEEMLIKEIQEHISLHPVSRTSKAWELAEKHYKNCTLDNVELFNQIYQYVCRNQTIFGSTFFSKFKAVPELTAQDIKNPGNKDKTIDDINFWFAALTSHVNCVAEQRKKSIYRS